jgi:DNA-binding transcriptional LysR family regulator
MITSARRLRLRDLRVFFAVVQAGSLAKAAVQLRVSQPAVSQVIADLEHALGARLFDRSSRGVEPTVYARALLARGRVAFDELRQAIRDIEFLSDSTAGELVIGYPVSLATLLPEMIARFSEKYPRVVMHTEIVPSPALRFGGLRERTHDLVLARMPTPLLPGYSVEDLNVEVLFDDPSSSWPARTARGRAAARSISPTLSTSPGFYRRPARWRTPVSPRLSRRGVWNARAQVW